VENLWKARDAPGFQYASGAAHYVMFPHKSGDPMSVTAIGNFVPRRYVSIRRDGEDFVVVFEAEDIIAFRSEDANALTRVCRWLRYAITNDYAVTNPREKALAA
jgi:hypothetical protein